MRHGSQHMLITTRLQKTSQSLTRKMLQSRISLQSVSEISNNLTTSVNSLTSAVTEKIDNFTANPPVQRVEKTIRIAKESWQIYLAIFISVFTLMFFVASVVWQEARIEKCRISDIKYHYILMHNGVNSAGLDSIESWFRNPD